MGRRLCWCGHEWDWDHYHRTPGNGQKFDWICVKCVGQKEIDMWHEPKQEM